LGRWATENRPTRIGGRESESWREKENEGDGGSAELLVGPCLTGPSGGRREMSEEKRRRGLGRLGLWDKTSPNRAG